MDMTGIETLLGPVGASPLDTEPLTTGFPSSTLSTDDDGHTLLVLPLWLSYRRWGFWSVVKGATAVAVCAAVLYALRCCLRRRRATSLQRIQSPPLTPRHKGKWTIVPSTPTLTTPPVKGRGSPMEEVTMEFGGGSGDEAEPSTHSTTSNISRTPLTSQLSEEFNLTFREDSLGSDTVWTEDTGPPVSSGEQGGEVVREKDTEPSTLVTSEATVTIS